MAAYDDMIASRSVVDEQTKIAGAKKAKEAAKAQASPSGLESFRAAEAKSAPSSGSPEGITGALAGLSGGSGTPAGGSGTGTGTGTGTGGNDGVLIASDGTKFTDENAYATYEAALIGQKTANYQAGQYAAQAAADAQAGRVSAFNILKDEFSKYGLGSLVDGIKNLLTNGTPASEFALRLRETPEYKARFAANEARIAAGLSALSPAEYVAMEDQYQNVMRNYGLPDSYYTKDTMGKQAGFEKFLANDVSAAELEDRIATAQQRVLNSNPEVLQALKQFYPDISNADILAYTLDPKNALNNIKRKVTAAEIGGAALAQGLQANGGTAESLAGQGITKAQAQAGYADVAGILPRGSELASIYGESPYTQQTAEAEVFNTTGAAEAARKRKKLTELEKASFSGSSGVGALSRDRATNYGTTQSGFGSY